MDLLYGGRISREAMLWDRTGYYLEFADAFGWTYDQVEEMPAWLASRMMTAYKILQQVRHEKREAAERAANR